MNFCQFSFRIEAKITVNYTVSYLLCKAQMIVPTDSLNKRISKIKQRSQKWLPNEL